MNQRVLWIKHRLPAGILSRIGLKYYRVSSSMALVRGMVQSTRILLSHLSAEIVPGFYWRRLKRLFIARRSQG